MEINNLEKLIFTNHALIRSQQRGISSRAIATILDYGHFSFVKGGAKSWMMNKREKEFAKADLGQEYIKIEKQLGYLVISSEGVVITAGHSYKRVRNK